MNFEYVFPAANECTDGSSKIGRKYFWDSGRTADPDLVPDTGGRVQIVPLITRAAERISDRCDV